MHIILGGKLSCIVGSLEIPLTSLELIILDDNTVSWPIIVKMLLRKSLIIPTRFKYKATKVPVVSQLDGTWNINLWSLF